MMTIVAEILDRISGMTKPPTQVSLELIRHPAAVPRARWFARHHWRVINVHIKDSSGVECKPGGGKR